MGSAPANCLRRIAATLSLVLSTAPLFGANADLKVSCSASPDPVTSGALVTCLITVSNQGPSAASQVQLTDAFSPGATIFSVNVSQGTYSQSAGTINFTLGSVAANVSAHATVVLFQTMPGMLTNSLGV